MDVASVLCMNPPGDGKRSYANNSLLQRITISKSKPFLVETTKNMIRSMKRSSSSVNGGWPACFRVADLGCSSGPNTLQVISEIINTIDDDIICNQQKDDRDHHDPEIQVFLNDLPTNDFNSVLKEVPAFYNQRDKNKLRCFVSAVAGSFYGRLFPKESLDFVHSSTSLHWLSKVPDYINEENKGKIYIAHSSPPNVYKAYKEQFEKDFSNFLRLRCEEMKAGGCMLLILVGRRIPHPSASKYFSPFWDLLATSLMDLVAKGLVKEDDINSFNMPCYTPYKEEVREIIEKEGSFNLDKLETLEVNWDLREAIEIGEENFVLNENQSGQIISDYIRAIAESILVHHFGEAIIDSLFKTYSEHITEYLHFHNPKHVNILLSMTKK
ncbi:benzoate carboxyl methyltransferase-like [Carica papaya]|uniref:benzoate carboxyl methyltransferase-like n=1 Tax=Carica papaya TaxID=3649 RepID=UPI000B8CC12E|nr:benzoate carboxyl methyltransferase-like [Carica papaya]